MIIKLTKVELNSQAVLYKFTFLFNSKGVFTVISLDFLVVVLFFCSCWSQHLISIQEYSFHASVPRLLFLLLLSAEIWTDLLDYGFWDGAENQNFQLLEAWECYMNIEAVQDIGASGYVPE